MDINNIKVMESKPKSERELIQNVLDSILGPRSGQMIAIDGLPEGVQVEVIGGVMKNILDLFEKDPGILNSINSLNELAQYLNNDSLIKGVGTKLHQYNKDGTLNDFVEYIKKTSSHLRIYEGDVTMKIFEKLRESTLYEEVPDSEK